MEHTDERELRAGAGDAFAKAFEMIATPAIFGLGGWFLDGRLGTFPLVTLAAVFVVFGYQLWRFAREYGTHMDEALARRRAGYARAQTRHSGGPVHSGERRSLPRRP